MTQIIPETQPEFDKTNVIERPDGFYWVNQETDKQYGPFSTLLEATQDMSYSDGLALEAGETLLEAESELGINDWIDPDTGEPAEETYTHIEEH